MDLSVSVIIVAGGKGTRLGSATPKQFLPLKGTPLILHSIKVLLDLPWTKEVIVACDTKFNPHFSKGLTLKFAPSGERRQDSVWNALQCVSPDADLVCIHDAARPLLNSADAQAVILEAATSGAAALAVRAKNTIKEVSPEGFVTKTLDRTKLWEMQTPQVMKTSLLKEGFAIAHAKNLTVTDDIALVELTKHPVKLVAGSYSNIKLTTPEDWPLLEALLCDDTAEV